MTRIFWEGAGFQFAAMVFVIGSYYLSEGRRKNRIFSAKGQMVIQRLKHRRQAPESSDACRNA